jgi:hypothetical protein
MTTNPPAPVHTPGPWRHERISESPWWHRFEVYTEMGPVFAFPANDKETEATCLANARLAVAAPDMIAALRETIDQGQHADGCGWWDTSARDLQSKAGRDVADAACNCYLRSVAAAIRKSERAMPVDRSQLHDTLGEPS